MKWFSRLCLVAALALSGASVANAVSAGPPNPDLFAACNASAQYDASTNGRTILVTHSGTTAVYPCGFDILGAAGAVNVQIVYGTGTNCATNTVAITPAFQLTSSVGGIVDHLPVYTGLPVAPSGQDVCLNTSAGVAVQAIFYYAQF